MSSVHTVYAVLPSALGVNSAGTRYLIGILHDPLNGRVCEEIDMFEGHPIIGLVKMMVTGDSRPQERAMRQLHLLRRRYPTAKIIVIGRSAGFLVGAQCALAQDSPVAGLIGMSPCAAVGKSTLQTLPSQPTLLIGGSADKDFVKAKEVYKGHPAVQVEELSGLKHMFDEMFFFFGIKNKGYDSTAADNQRYLIAGWMTQNKLWPHQ